MLTDEAVARQLGEARRQLVQWAEQIEARRVTLGTAVEVRHLTDVLTCLLDECAPSNREPIEYLIDRCEALLGRLAN